MRRRAFLALAGGAAAAWPLAAGAQQAKMPVIGFIRSTPAAPFEHLVAAFRQGLAEMGFVEGRNVTIEYRYADNRLDRLPALAGELVDRGVSVIVANSLAAEAAKRATGTIPIVFVTGDDPVTRGLVASLSQPEANVTGLTFFGGGALGAKRVELVHELVPKAVLLGVLMDPNWPGSAAELLDVEEAGRARGLKITVAKAASEPELAGAFERLGWAGIDALLVSGGPFFTSQRRTLVGLAGRHAMPAIYDVRDYVDAGGLISYSASLTGAYRQAAVYAGRILKGEKPANMPVQQPTTLELAINLKTARALGITVPQSILVRADEVIE